MVFIDFWGISRFNILGGLRFKVTLYQNRYFWLKSPIFQCPVNLKAIFKKIGKTQNWQFIHISL